MQVLVTGANGFIGSHLCAALTERGSGVRRAVRRTQAPARDTVAVGEIDGTTDWGRALAGIDAVVHCAARVHVLREKSSDPLAAFRRVNVEGTRALARQAAMAGVRRFLLLSTVKVNGEETFDHPFAATDPPAPADPYGVSKLEAEQVLQEIAGESGMETVIIRPPLVYGRGVGGNFARLVGLVRGGWWLPFGAVRNRRSLVGVENLCSLLLCCLDHPAAAGQVFLVRDNEDVSTPELIRAIASACGVPPRLLPVPPWLLEGLARLCGRGAEMRRLTGSLQVDSSAAADLLAWLPPLTLAQGLHRSVA